MLLHTSSIAFRHLSWRSSYATAHSQHRFPAPFLEAILCYCTLPASLSGTFPGGHPMLLHTPSIAFRHLSWRSSYATAHSQHRFPAPFLEVILCYCTLPASLSGTFLVGPMTRLSADTWDHRDVRTVTWNHGYDGLWSESQQAYGDPSRRMAAIRFYLLSRRQFSAHPESTD